MKINDNLKIYLVTDAMGYVPTCFVIAETSKEAREIWQEANDPHGTDRSWIHECREITYFEMTERPDLYVLNEDAMDQYCPF